MTDEPRAEHAAMIVRHLSTLCAEHCDPDGEGHDGDKCGADFDAIARIRREAGLT